MERKKIVFSTELAYLVGLVALAVGTALMERADFGMSMIVAPAYLVYLKLSSLFPGFTFGMAEYLAQAVLMVAMMVILRSFKIRYLFAFVTTIIYGAMLDISIYFVGLIPVRESDYLIRLCLYLLGIPMCSLGVAFLFRTYLPPEVYELFVKEISEKYGFQVSRCKTVYDIISCLIGVAMSFAFFGLWHFEGVKLGTVFCAIINGTLIGFCMKLMDRRMEFKDYLQPFRAPQN